MYELCKIWKVVKFVELIGKCFELNKRDIIFGVGWKYLRLMNLEMVFFWIIVSKLG